MKTRDDKVQLKIVAFRSPSMVRETASESNGWSDSQDKGFCSCRKGRCLVSLKFAVVPNVLENLHC